MQDQEPERDDPLAARADLESQAVAAWVIFPTDPLWDLVTVDWFRDMTWRQIWHWIAKTPDIRPGDRLPRLLMAHRHLGIAAMEAARQWGDTVCLPQLILPHLRQLMEYRRVQVILSQGLRVDPMERDPAEWTLDALQDELAQRNREHRMGLTAREGVAALTEQLAMMDSQGGANPAMLLTGYPDLDDAMFGLWPEDFVVIGGRPGTGKTTLVLNWVRHWVHDLGQMVGYVSLEMSAASLHATWAAQSLGIPVRTILSPMDPNQRRAIHAQLNRQYPWPLRMWADPINLDTLRGTVRQWHRDHPLAVLVVDYLQLVERAPGTRNEEEHVSLISQGLRNLAKELRIPVVAISSSNRGNGENEKAPTMRELRHSGQIEHDASKILLMYEPGDSPRDDAGWQDLRVRVVKVRQGGRLGTVTLRIHAGTQQVVNAPGDSR